MKQRAILLLACVLAAACDSNISGLDRPVLVSSSGANASASTGVLVSPGTAALTVGNTMQVSARAVDANGATVNGTVSWSSSNSAVATVDGSGVVVARAVGTAVITAVVNGVSGNAVVTVT